MTLHDPPSTGPFTPRPATSMAEYAGSIAVFLFLLVGGLQISLLVVQYLSVQHVARDTARWLAIQPDNLDSAVVTHAQAINLPGAGAAGITSVTASPPCTVLVGGVCTGRPSGQPVTVTVVPNPASVTFVPTTFRIGTITWNVPVSLPAVSISMNVE